MPRRPRGFKPARRHRDAKGAAPTTADLPVRAAAPVEYVRTCPNDPIGGRGFFVIPGTETCLQISGYVRAEYRFQERNEATTPALGAVDGRRTQDDIEFFARGMLNFDARTPTEYGTLRSVITLLIDSEETSGGFGTTYTNRGRIDLDRAYIQFANITAGRAASFFTFFGGNLYGPSNGAADPGTELLAYTATFGPGFSASLSIENAVATRDTITDARFAGLAYGGQELPNLVANFNVSQAWGSAQIMGAVQQVRHNLNATVDDELGYAIGAGLNLRLPMIAAGDQLWLQAVYADGAIGYVDLPTATADFTAVNSDATVNALGTSLSTNSAWAVVAGFRHFFTPNISTNLYGAFGAYDQGTVTAALPDNSYTWWQAGANLGWTPVSGLLIGAEVAYTAIDLDRAVEGRDVDGVLVDEGSRWEGRIRIQRSF